MSDLPSAGSPDHRLSVGGRRSRRRRPLRPAGPAVVVAAVAALTTACATAGGSVAAPATGNGLPTVPPPPTAQLTSEQVDRALASLDGLVTDAMERTGVPGVAVAVVYRDEVVYSQGFGVREVGKPEAVDADTVFQLASLSKPLASTVVAGVVGSGVIEWDDPVVASNPDFALQDPYVTANATFEDMLSHRSGLSTGAGDLLEDLGYDREYILGHLDQQPLAPFRSSYNYSNFGFTAGAEAAADATATPWEDLAEQTLFEPLGMTETSYRHEDYVAAANRAAIHVPTGDRTWAALYQRDADAEAPAGGASSSVHDLAQWMRLQLGAGVYDGEQVIDADALTVTRTPHSVSNPPGSPVSRTGFYGLGWNVSYDDQGRLQIDHSGAFNLGAATSVRMLPVEQLGIVALTNGHPEGIPEAITAGFLDVAQHGTPTLDWLTAFAGLFAQLEEEDAPETDWSQPPAQVEPASAPDAYVGTYDNPYYGPLTVTADGDALSMSMGPQDRPTVFPLTHYSGDVFTFESIGENANGLAGAIFTIGPDGRASSVRLDFYDRTGLGTFTRG